ncbi:hypothetical protein Slala03_72270 [Streptomyces lavendulae subsp. lavendulae]|nr:hypothetical protein Slala03_72270 [Streptomyces lavendulae subsp. lavendulae]
MFESVFEYLDLESSIREPDHPVRLAAPAGRLRFEHVHFAYPGTRPDLRNIDFVVRDLSFAGLAETVGVVSQVVHLFHTTVADNLRFANPGASDRELVDAAEAGHLHELIRSLPDGYDTLVGERGYRFSGGEKQRLAIARTMLGNPPLLVLDEATSALDTYTEASVQRALDALAAGPTTVTIAHRLSTVRNADRIIVLDKGRIVETGTHTSLLHRRGHYAAFVHADPRAPGRRPGVQFRGAGRSGE